VHEDRRARGDVAGIAYGDADEVVSGLEIDEVDVPSCSANSNTGTAAIIGPGDGFEGFTTGRSGGAGEADERCGGGVGAGGGWCGDGKGGRCEVGPGGNVPEIIIERGDAAAGGRSSASGPTREGGDDEKEIGAGGVGNVAGGPVVGAGCEGVGAGVDAAAAGPG